MKEFLKKHINWKIFTYEMLGVVVFIVLSYWVGNNKFPHNFWIVPIFPIVIGIAVLLYAYSDYKIKKDKFEN